MQVICNCYSIQNGTTSYIAVLLTLKPIGNYDKALQPSPGYTPDKLAMGLSKAYMSRASFTPLKVVAVAYTQSDDTP